MPEPTKAPLSSEKRALAARQLRGTPTAEALAGEPIAVIGLACRFPGADSPAAFWDLLARGVDAIREVPSDRWDARAYYDPDPAAPGKMVTRWGGFLSSVDGFDPQFFGISPREALRMDPQQRIVLELAWEALEDAGIPREKVSGTQAGVFLGGCIGEYRGFQIGQDSAIDGYAGSGSAGSILSNRVSFSFDLRGPSVTIDTACSSSLVALHMAVQSLRAGDSSLALAGGINLILTPTYSISFSKAGMLAPDGRCKTFDSRANGYVRGDGCGIVVLKRLADALADGDRILAVLRGSAVNQDGRTTALTAPSGPAQQAVIRQALANAGLTPADIGYVEAHGTGTSLGDPIEFEALAEVMGTPGQGNGPIGLGSVKTNVGHLEIAAGIAGVIKVILSLQNELIPPHLHFQRPNPNIPLAGSRFFIPTKPHPWPRSPKRRAAGVSSFGFGGTNAHVIFEEAPPIPVRETPAAGPEALVPLSAQSPEALRALAAAYRKLVGTEGMDLPTLAWNAAHRRSHHAHRLAVVAGTPEELARGLEAYEKGDPLPAGATTGEKNPERTPRVAFVFSGQGSQWPGMARDLIEKHAVFREAFERVDRLVQAATGWSVAAEIARPAPESRLGRTDVAQPAIFAVQVALAEVWRAWGIAPVAVAGHSIGEFAAAVTAGVLDVETAVRAVVARGQAMQKVAGKGKMVALEIPPDQAEQAIGEFRDRVSIAAVNAPGSVVLSGESAAVDEIAGRLKAGGVEIRPLRVDYAFHSVQMDPLLEELRAAFARIAPASGSVPFYSTVHGRRTPGEELGPEYWLTNARQPVRLADAASALASEGIEALIEIGPHPVLSANLAACLERTNREGLVLGSMKRDAQARKTLLGSLGALYVAGLPIDWTKTHGRRMRLMDLPTYPWQRTRLWFADEFQKEGSVQAAPATSAGVPTGHPLLGSRLRLARGESVFETRFGPGTPIVRDHRVHGSVVVPLVTFIEMALAATRLRHGASRLAEATVYEPLILPDGAEPRLVQTTLGTSENGRATLSIASWAEEGGDENWTIHFSCTVVLGEPAAPEPVDPAAIAARCPEEIPPSDYFAALRALGLAHGPSFQGIEWLRRTDGEALGRIRLPEALLEGLADQSIHVALLEPAFLVLGAAVPASARKVEDVFLPIGLENFTLLRRPGPIVHSHARIRPVGNSIEAFTGDLALFDDEGTVATATGLAIKRATRDALARGLERVDDWFYRVEWTARALERAGKEEEKRPGDWWLLADPDGVAQALAARLARRGKRATLIFPGEAFGRTAQDEYRLDPARHDHWRELLAEHIHSGGQFPEGFVHLSSVGSPSIEDLTKGGLEESAHLGVEAALAIVQVLLEKENVSAPAFWLVTRGGECVLGAAEPAPLQVGQSPLWGFGRALTVEHPETRTRLVDVDPTLSSDAAAEALAREIAAGADELELGFRGVRRYVPRLVRVRVPRRAEDGGLRVLPDATYLFVGGLGGLGLAAANWLAEKGARHLVLVGRKPPAEDARKTIARMEGSGVRVTIALGDVADEARIAEILAPLGKTSPPLRGVFHTAGVLDDGVVLGLDAARFRKVLAPKVTGSWNLHRLTEGTPLDFFVLYSSGSALLGSAARSNYAAANAFLDLLAHRRRQLGLPALSIGWGPWADFGMAARLAQAGGRVSVAASLVADIPPARGLAALGRLLAADGIAQASVLPIRWGRMLEQAGTIPVPPILSDLVREATRAPAAKVGPDAARGAAGGDGARRPLRDTLAELPAARRGPALEAHLRGRISKLLNLAEDRISDRARLADLGFDSLTGMELRNSLQWDLGIPLPVTLLWNYPTLPLLARHLADKMGVQAPGGSGPAPAGGESGLAVAVEARPGEG